MRVVSLACIPSTPLTESAWRDTFWLKGIQEKNGGRYFLCVVDTQREAGRDWNDVLAKEVEKKIKVWYSADKGPCVTSITDYRLLGMLGIIHQRGVPSCRGWTPQWDPHACIRAVSLCQARESSIRFAFNCFVVSLFCLNSLTYTVKMITFMVDKCFVDYWVLLPKL